LHRSLFITLFVFAAATLSAAPIELDRAAAAMSGKEASFTHRFTAKGFKSSQVESGSVVFGALPAMRWSYATPEEKLFVFDGTNSWFYVPADKQVTVGQVTDARKSELPFLLLGDPAARDKYFIVRQRAGKGAVVTTLEPRAKGSMVHAVTVSIDPATHLIQRIEYADREGNRTSFDFSGYHSRTASAATFTFVPPAGVQVIRAD
jgi:chaperone LolA